MNHVLTSAGRASLDSKIAATTLHLEYFFGHGVNFRDRIYQITGEIEFPAFDHLDAALTEFEKENARKTITIRINSPGGSVYEALAIIGRLRKSPCHIVTEAYGHVMSAATLILASGDRRKMSEFSWIMHHESSYVSEGRHSQNKAAVAQAEREEDAWAHWMGQLTGRPKAFWKQEGVSIDGYYDAVQALELGIIDEVF